MELSDVVDGEPPLDVTPMNQTRLAVLSAALVAICSPAAAKQDLSVSTPTLELTFQVKDAAFAVTDRRSGQTWSQRPNRNVVVLDARPVEGGVDLRLRPAAGGPEIAAAIRLEREAPEVVVDLKADGPLADSLPFPSSFISRPGETLILPVNEGIGYPVDDATHRTDVV